MHAKPAVWWKQPGTWQPSHNHGDAPELKLYPPSPPPKVITTSPLEEPATKPNRGEGTPAQIDIKLPQIGATTKPQSSLIMLNKQTERDQIPP